MTTIAELQALQELVCNTPSSNGQTFVTLRDQTGLRWLDPTSGQSYADVTLEAFEGLQTVVDAIAVGNDVEPANVLMSIVNASGTTGGAATAIFTAQQLLDAGENIGAFLDARFGN